MCVFDQNWILLNHKKAYTFQQWAGKVINCIFSNIFIPNRLIILYFFNLYLDSHKCPILFKAVNWYWLPGLGIMSFLDYYSWSWSVVWPMLSNELDRNIYIYTDPRQRFCLTLIFFIVYICNVSSKNINM